MRAMRWHTTVLVLGILLALGFGYWWNRTYEPVGVIQDQLTAIDKGIYHQAYNYLSSAAKAKLTIEEFVALIQNNSVVMETRSSSSLTRKRDGQTAVISGMLTGYGHLTSQVTYVLVQEDGQWRIQSFQWDPPRRYRE